MAANKAHRRNKPSGKTGLTGKVLLQKVAEGSKSEHDAVCLETEGETFVLRRVGGNAFNDPELRSWVGKKVVLQGTMHKPYFMVTAIEAINE